MWRYACEHHDSLKTNTVPPRSRTPCRCARCTESVETIQKKEVVSKEKKIFSLEMSISAANYKLLTRKEELKSPEMYETDEVVRFLGELIEQFETELKILRSPDRT